MSQSNSKQSDTPLADTILSPSDRMLSGESASVNSVLLGRTTRGWSQAELAKRAEISRASVSAIESGRLTPSVTAALSLARALECTVEELFSRPTAAEKTGRTWAWLPWQESCRYWEAEISGKRLFYPVEGVALNPFLHDGMQQDGVFHGSRNESAEITLTVATCDPAVSLLAREYTRESGFRMLVFPRSGGASLELVRRRLIHVGALHRSTLEKPERNTESVRAEMGGNARLLRVAQWESGVAHATHQQKSTVSALSRSIRQWAVREPGSAARECLDDLLHGKTASGRVVDSHSGVTEAVRAGWAEAGVCVKVSAMEAHLNFLPLQIESLDFCFHTSQENDPRIQALIRVLRGRRYRQMLAELPGYDAKSTGDLMSV